MKDMDYNGTDDTNKNQKVNSKKQKDKIGSLVLNKKLRHVSSIETPAIRNGAVMNPGKHNELRQMDRAT